MKKNIPTSSALCCARCTKPIVGEQHKVGRYTYGDCCVLKVLDEKPNARPS